MAEKLKQTYQGYKAKFHGLVILTVASTAIFAFALNTLSQKNSESAAAKEELDRLISLRESLSKNLNKERDNEDSVKAFLVDWSPYLNANLNAVKILEELERIAQSKGCEITKKSTASTAGKDFPVATLKTSSVGDLKGLLEFLASAEELFPMMKIGDIVISERANILSLDLTFKYPMFNEKA